jgi:hypothetical protein
MRCFVCSFHQVGFQCTTCLEQKLTLYQSQYQEYNKIPIISPETPLISTIITWKNRLSFLQFQIQLKTRLLKQSRCDVVAAQRIQQEKQSRLQRLSKKQPLGEPSSIESIPFETLVQYQCYLIKDLVSIFRLRKVIRNQSKLEYRILSVGFSPFSMLCKCEPVLQRKWNAGIMFVVAFLLQMSHYLEIILPYRLQFGAPCTIHSKSEHTHELHLSPETNQLDEFITALSKLNYNIAYLCSTQSVSIPLDQCHETLEMLAKCCSSSRLAQ